MSCLPEPRKKLIVISPIEMVVAYLKISVIGGLLVAMPYILYELWKFAASRALSERKEIRLAVRFFRHRVFRWRRCLWFLRFSADHVSNSAPWCCRRNR